MQQTDKKEETDRHVSVIDEYERFWDLALSKANVGGQRDDNPKSAMYCSASVALALLFRSELMRRPL